MPTMDVSGSESVGYGVEWRETNFLEPAELKNGTHAFVDGRHVAKHSVGTMSRGPAVGGFESTWPRRPGELADVLASALKPHGGRALLVDLAFADGRFVGAYELQKREGMGAAACHGSSSSTACCGGVGAIDPQPPSRSGALLGPAAARPASVPCTLIVSLVAAW